MKYFFLTFSIGFAALTALLLWRRITVLVSGGIAEGWVVEHERREIDDSLAYHPVVTFVDHDGHPHRFTSTAGGGRAKPLRGSRVTVRYLRSRPDRAYIATAFHLWAGPLGCGVMSALALLGWSRM